MLQQLHLQISAAANQLQTQIDGHVAQPLRPFYYKPVNVMRKMVHNDLQNHVGIDQNATGRLRQMKKDMKTFTNGYIKLILNESDAFFASDLVTCLQQIAVDDEYARKLDATQTILQSAKETEVLQWLVDFSEYSPLFPNQIVNFKGEYAVVWATSDNGLWVALDLHEQRIVAHRGHVAV
jgi:hypothetical protein